MRPDDDDKRASPRSDDWNLGFGAPSPRLVNVEPRRGALVDHRGRRLTRKVGFVPSGPRGGE